ncbi:MAG: protein-L-isoaspartate(D-aspartate) O-methyltransferase [Bacteroidetes bacterium]|nr:protein-L-isoaspartate(D-aspartate) O-methyltransferase [Bacteroidota bacterium]
MVGDSHKHQGMRKKLVDQLRRKGIQDERVLAAVASVPRHLFLDPAFLEHAYEDKAFRIGAGQTISQPYTVAYQSSLLELKPGMKVLEIGTGSGYQASILAAMGAKVFSIERHKSLFEEAKERLRMLGYSKVKTFFGDGFLGQPSFAPYDRILITAAAPEIPRLLLEQLAVGGFLVLPLDSENGTMMIRITKAPSGEFVREDFENFRFVPMLKGKVF